MKRAPLLLAGFLLATTVWAAEPTAPFAFVPPWDDASPGITNMSGLLEKPAGAHGFVVVKDGHLYVGKKRFRIFGVNTAFGANFPSHEDAEKIAPRMAKFGINGVRIHHMDNQKAPSGIWSADMRTFDPSQLDKLDYFIAQLKANGIYVDLNLHVSRNYPGMEKWEGRLEYFKGVDLFYQPMIEMQKDYARQLLTHVNPYTKNAYVDEPAVAIVEINNENGIFCEWVRGLLEDVPDLYKGDLETRWNRWLKAKYASQKDLEKAWPAINEPVGAEMLREGNFAQGLGSAWNLEQREGAQAEASAVTDGSSSGLNLKVTKPGVTGWHVQLWQNKTAFTQDKTYTISFRAKANADASSSRVVKVAVTQAHAPWDPLWSVDVKLTPEWKTYKFTFKPSISDDNSRVVFGDLGTTTGEYQFADVSLRPGGHYGGLQEGEQFGAIPFFKKSGFAARSLEAQRDWVKFLWEIEDGYWADMQRFLKRDLKTRSLLVGTATWYSPAPIQAKFDIVDAHAYWQHPQFPAKPWDRANWIVENKSMAGVPDGGTLPSLAFRRVAGKPYICTEYNAPAPNIYSAEAFLLVNAFAAMQDWDGVFAFAYSHRTNDWNARRIPNFFDIDQHPAKLATLPAAVAMFMRGDVAKASATTTLRVSHDQAIDATRRLGSQWTSEDVSGKSKAWLNSITQMDFSEAPVASKAAQPTVNDTPQMTWDTVKSRVTVNSPRSKACIGPVNAGPAVLGDVTIIPGATQNDWSAIALTAMDGPDFKSPGRILITAAGEVHNTGMQWTNDQKNSLGANWGKAPSLANGVAAHIMLPVPATRLKAWALDDRGQRSREVPVHSESSGASLNLGAEYQTLWYEVDVLKP